ncbi:MAG: hypothetical protein R2745_15585 [Vicinamibacterales bacterium]
MRYDVITVVLALAIGTAGCSSRPALIAEADLVPPAQLAAALVPVSGWTMAAAETNAVTGEMAMSTAKTTYSRGGTTLSVDVTDSGIFARAVANLTSGYSENLEGRTEAKSATIAGTPGVENWDDVSKDGMVTLLVANRFVVTVKGSGVDNLGVVRDFAAGFDTKPLAALASYKAA